MTTKAQAKFTPGTEVEVWRIDITKGPAVEAQHAWMRGVVDRVEVGVGGNEKLVTVFVNIGDHGKSAQIVGPRGGNKNIRTVE